MWLSANRALRTLVEKYPELKGQHVETRIIQQTNNAGGKYDPLTDGGEVLIQAEMDGACGQALTFHPRAFSGTVDAVANLPEVNPYYYPVVVAVLNAAARKVGELDHTMQCTNGASKRCAQEVIQYIIDNHGICRLGMIGYQPALVEQAVNLLGLENVAVTDLNPDTIGSCQYGVEVWDGDKYNQDILDFGNVILLNGSALINGGKEAIIKGIGSKPFYTYGTTAAALAKYNGLPRLCPASE